jgi:hypothetical protein
MKKHIKLIYISLAKNSWVVERAVYRQHNKGIHDGNIIGLFIRSSLVTSSYTSSSIKEAVDFLERYKK